MSTLRQLTIQIIFSFDADTDLDLYVSSTQLSTISLTVLLQTWHSILSLPGAADLDAALGFHQLQFGLCQLQLQVPQLLLQSVLLLVQRLGGCLVPARGRRLEGPQGAEQVPAVVTAHHFTLHGHTNTHMYVSRGWGGEHTI